MTTKAGDDSSAARECRSRIGEAREAIDRLDRDIVRLLNERAAHVRAIGRAKRVLGEPVYQPDRETEVFEQVEAANEGPLDAGAIRRLFERIIDEARRLERAELADEGIAAGRADDEQTKP